MTYNITPREELIWYGIDLDGTLAYHVWPDPGLGDPIWTNVNKLWELREAGKKIIIHTARGWEAYELIESWLDDWAIPYDRIVCGKLLAHRYVDDKAIHESEASWL